MKDHYLAMALVPLAVLGAGAGAVGLKISKGKPQMRPRVRASISARRAINDYWRNRVPLSFTVETTNDSDYQNFYVDYPRRFLDPVTKRPYWSVPNPDRNNATIQNNPYIRTPSIWSTDNPDPPQKRPPGGKAPRRRGTMPTY